MKPVESIIIAIVLLLAVIGFFFLKGLIKAIRNASEFRDMFDEKYFDNDRGNE